MCVGLSKIKISEYLDYIKDSFSKEIFKNADDETLEDISILKNSHLMIGEPNILFGTYQILQVKQFLILMRFKLNILCLEAYLRTGFLI